MNTFYTPEVVRDKLARTGFDVEDTRFVMDSPFALGLVRLSWKLDRFPRVLAPVRTLGYVLLGAVWSASRPFRAGPRRSDAAGGLTLVVRARKRAA